jgi:hypothetical protein
VRSRESQIVCKMLDWCRFVIAKEGSSP